MHLNLNDLPSPLNCTSVAVDTETMGLSFHRDRLCLIQLATSEGDVHLVQLEMGQGHNAQNLKKLFSDPSILKIFHYARFDMAMIYKNLQVMPSPVYCTKIASRLARTYTSRHGLKDLCKELLGVDLSKEEQTSDWGASLLTESQKKYAANDVIYLHDLKEKLDIMLKREKRDDYAQKSFDFLPTRAQFDLMCGENFDIFAHKES